MACFRCGSMNHFANSCFAKTSVAGKRLAYLHVRRVMTIKKTAFKTVTKKPRFSTRRSGVYVLRATAGMYYVGKSCDIDASIQEHRSGDGASCLGGSSFLLVTRLLTSGSSGDLESWERNETVYPEKSKPTTPP
jgi:hypothetical protein